MTALRSKLTAESRLKLAKCESYQDFLKTYFSELNLSYAEVARRGGFSSRSYPRDVTEGRRRLTVKSMPSLVRGLRLENDLVRVFQSLYFNEHPTEHPDSPSQESLSKRLEVDRQRVVRGALKPARQRVRIPKDRSRDNNPQWLASGLIDVMAGLGDSKSGATFEEIRLRTGITRILLRKQLDALLTVGAIQPSPDGEGYVASAEHVDWTDYGKADVAKYACVSAIERMGRAADAHFASDETLFMNSGFAIAKSDLPRLKKELRELLLSFIDRSIDSASSTETIVHIVSGLFEGRIAPSKT